MNPITFLTNEIMIPFLSFSLPQHLPQFWIWNYFTYHYCKNITLPINKTTV